MLRRRKEQFQFFSRGKILVKGLGEMETYFIEHANEFVDTAAMLTESDVGDSQPTLSVSQNIGHRNSFTQYSRLVQLAPRPSIDNTTSLSTISEKESGPLVGIDLSTCSHLSAMDNIIIAVPTSDEIMRYKEGKEEEEKQLVNKDARSFTSLSTLAGDVPKGYAKPLSIEVPSATKVPPKETLSKGATTETSSSKEMMMSQVFGFILLCFPFTLGLLLTISEGS